MASAAATIQMKSAQNGTAAASPSTAMPIATATSGSTTVRPAMTRSGEPTEYAVCTK